MHLKNWITSAFTPVLAFVLVHGMAAAGADQSDHQHQFSASDPQLVEKAKGGHFTLQSLDGPISHADLHGKVTLLFFGFTSCVDVCPMTLWAVTRGFLELTEQELERVSALFVSVDPEYDTPDVLKKYTELFHPNIVGATSSLENLKKIAKNYGVEFHRKEKPGAPRGYVINHTPDILLLDPHGRLLKTRIKYPPDTEKIVARVKKLLTRS